MSESVEKEVEAIKVVLKALEPLSPEARASVLEYVLKRLQVAVGIPIQVASGPGSSRGADARSFTARAGDEAGSPAHIKDLKEKRKPRSANEMAALVAYYLSAIVPEAERKTTVTTKDIETFFKIAEYPLPEKVQFTLPNAKAAGYLDAVGDGEYKLNAVGHNLVVHSMPRGPDTKSGKKKRSKKARAPAKNR